MTDVAIVLAGGLGTRLQSVVKDVPKPMAEVAGRPFLNYLMYFLSTNKIRKVILAVGYKYEIIKEYLDIADHRYGLDISYSIETEMLGTGGAIFKAFEQVDGEFAFILNGDTFFDIPLSDLEAFAQSSSADIAFALLETEHSSRYGSVNYTPSGRIVSFKEKSTSESQKMIINGGIYYMKKSLISTLSMPAKFSMEQDFFEKNLQNLQAYGKVYQALFIDIGIPSDYTLSQDLLKNIIV